MERASTVGSSPTSMPFSTLTEDRVYTLLENLTYLPGLFWYAWLTSIAPVQCIGVFMKTLFELFAFD